MLGLDAGQLNRRITISTATKAEDAVGQGIPTWVPLATVWAKYTPVSDGEKVRANEVFSDLMARFIIRYSTVVANVDTKAQITFDGRTFDVSGVKEIERRRWIEITASARGERP